MTATISLIVFGLCIVLFVWDKLPMATTAILGCAAMVIVGVCDFKTTFGQFASSSVILTSGVMVIGAGISETGLAEVISGWVVKVSRGSAKKLLIGTYVVSTLMSAFLTNSAVLAIFMPIVMCLSAADKKIDARNFIMPICYGCLIGGASTLVGSTQQLTAQGVLESMGAQTFRMFDFTPIGAILAVMGLFYCLCVGYKRGERIWGDRKDEVSTEMGTAEKQYSKKKMGIMAGIFVGTVVLYVTEWIPLAVTSTLAALMCIITGCLSQEKAIKSINWNIVGRLAGCLGLAEGMKVAGGVELISNAFGNVVGDSLSPFVLFCIAVFLAQAISELTIGSIAILIVLPVILSIAPDLGLNVYTFALGITIATGVTFSTPLASATLGMSMSAGYRFSDYFKYSIFFDISSYIAIILLVPNIYGLTV